MDSKLHNQRLRYSEAFYSVQGEGRFVGVPSVFLRTFGCNFRCMNFGIDRHPDRAEKLKQQGNRIIFIFNFTDSLDFWEYKDKEDIKENSKRIICRKDRPNHKGNEYLEIPIVELLNVSKK